MSAVTRSSMMRGAGVAATWQVRALLGVLGGGAAGAALAQSAPQGVPQSASLTNGISTGGTSFVDGFTSTTPGLAVITYLRHDALDAIKDARGNDVPVFDNPRIDATVLLTRFAYITPYTLFGGSLGVTALVPLVKLDASFGRNSIATLRDNGAGLGDVTFGPYLQMPPVIRNGRPVFSQRFELDTVTPVGKFDRDRGLNQSSGYWSLIPSYAFTVLPTPRWEVSARINYIYNFRSERRPNVPPGFDFRNGQAGDAGWISFATSWGVTPTLRLGVNAYYLTQFRDNRTNDERVADSRQRAFYAGPGACGVLMPGTSCSPTAIYPWRPETRRPAPT
ncbi:hypothetical protein EYC56_02180 [Xanthomonas oryzae]|nr:hypothetical protein EYC56_02180 [Xanthomonas oryzae]